MCDIPSGIDLLSRWTAPLWVFEPKIRKNSEQVLMSGPDNTARVTGCSQEFLFEKRSRRKGEQNWEFMVMSAPSRRQRGYR